MRLLPVLLFLITSVAECLMLSRMVVPHYAFYGEDAVLLCDFDLGSDRLYAVKWYKDNEEFFRYVPRFNPPIYVHPVDGIHVEKSKSSDKRVMLRSVTVRSTGVFRCEVSAEAPAFTSLWADGRMTVVYLPSEGPQITTGPIREEYEVGDVLDLNCTSSKSFPPAKLSWYINDIPVEVSSPVSLRPASLDPHPPTVDTYDGGGGISTNHAQQRHAQHHHSLMVSSLRLTLQLRRQHFGPNGNAKVRCVARISPLFWQEGDEKTFGHSSSSGGSSNHHHHHNSVTHRHQNTNRKTPVRGDEGGVSKGTHFNSASGEDSGDEHHLRFSHNPYDVEDHPNSEQRKFPFQREALLLVRGGCSSSVLLPGGGLYASWTTLHTTCLLLLVVVSSYWTVPSSSFQ